MIATIVQCTNPKCNRKAYRDNYEILGERCSKCGRKVKIIRSEIKEVKLR